MSDQVRGSIVTIHALLLLDVVGHGALLILERGFKQREVLGTPAASEFRREAPTSERAAVR
jgi:hypothetical protein